MKKIWIIITAVLLGIAVIGVLFFVFAGQTVAPTTNESTAPTGSSPSNTSGTSQEVAVGIANMAFSPATITIKKGQTVTWTNNESIPHDVVANDGSFKSATLGKGKSFSHTFNTTGTFSYICGIHPSMKGTVVVQ